MELIIGPSLALIASMFFNVVSAKKTELKITELEAEIALLQTKDQSLEGKLVGYSKSVDLKLIQTLKPVAESIKKLNDQVGI